MRFRKSREEEPGINMAPLIDIVFLLLIFFMVTSHFDIASGVKIDLPKVAKKLIGDKEQNNVTLIIDKSAQTFIEGQMIEVDALQENLRQMVTEKGVLHLILQADKDVSHGYVVRVMDLAKNAGVSSITIAARWNADGPL
jgi:biopolymer transport protein ExbD